jgi:uncharacterized protein (DUF2336 family)
VTELYSRLQHLVELAHDSSDERRRQLLTEVTDLFIDTASTVTDTQKGLFGDVINRVLPGVEKEARKALAEKMASEANAPHDVIVSLANDEIEVAAPVLSHSPVLLDSDLIDVIEHHGQAHMMSVSKRERVSEAVSDSLVARGDDAVVESLITNQGAQLSHSAFENVSRRAEGNERLRAPLVDRKDTPLDVLHEVFWSASLELRKKIMATTAIIDENELNRMLADSESAMLRELRERLAKADSAAEKFITAKEASGKLNLALLVELLRAGQIDNFIAGFARLARMDSGTVRHILADRNGEAAAIACRAMGLHWAHFSNLMQLVNYGRDRSELDHKRLVGLYNRLPQETAQRTMRFWRLRRDGLRKIEAEKRG